MKQIQKGFTLIELMIVVAIIGILAAIAIPQYQDYVTRARWSTAVTELGSFRTAVAECLQTNAGNPSSCTSFTSLGLTALPAAVAAGAVTVGTPTPSGTGPTGGTYSVTLTGNAQFLGCVITMVGTANEGSVIWDYYGPSGATCTRARTGFRQS